MQGTSVRRSNGLTRGRVHTVVFAICVSLLSACSTFDRGSPVPPRDKHEVTVLGLPNARLFVDQPAALSAEQGRALFAKRGLSASAAEVFCRPRIFCRS